MYAFDFFNNMLHPFTSNVTNLPSISCRENTSRQDCSILKLPRITMPTFQGNYIEWLLIFGQYVN